MVKLEYIRLINLVFTKYEKQRKKVQLVEIYSMYSFHTDLRYLGHAHADVSLWKGNYKRKSNKFSRVMITACSVTSNKQTTLIMCLVMSCLLFYVRRPLNSC